MATTKFISERNLRFLLYEVFDLESLADHPYYQEYNRKMFDMVLEQMVSIQKGLEKKRSRSETQFYNGKFHAFRFFFSYELPKIHGLAPRLMDSDRVTVEMQSELFND